MAKSSVPSPQLNFDNKNYNNEGYVSNGILK